jgi:hypothetical protein
MQQESRQASCRGHREKRQDYPSRRRDGGKVEMLIEMRNSKALSTRYPLRIEFYRLNPTSR